MIDFLAIMTGLYLSKNVGDQDIINHIEGISRPWQIGFQDPATPIAEGIVSLHHHVFFFLLMIFIVVCRMLYVILLDYWYNLPDTFNKGNQELVFLSKLKLTHDTTIEVIWTIVPSIILYFIAVPSFLILYSMDEIIDPAITVKAIGHQWYWSYEYSDYKINFDTINFDSYMIPTDELGIGESRLLEVDNPLVLPVKTHIRIIITASDVLHCWAVPQLGIKIDAVPGRLNQGSIFLKRLGIFYGQCSEICGVNHGFMPIVVKSVTMNEYLNWIIFNFE